jgi:CheY-like chemotaxis protein
MAPGENQRYNERGTEESMLLRLTAQLPKEPAVLFVDDDEMMRRIGRVALGPRITTVGTPDDAVRALVAIRFDAVLADLHLGEGEHDGLWVLERARELQPEALRWITTAGSDPRVDRAIAHGLVAALLPKPWLPERWGPQEG